MTSTMHSDVPILFVQSILFQSSIECAVADAQLLGSFLAIAGVALQGLLKSLSAPVVDIQVL